MRFSALLLRNLTYHWRANLAVVLGVMVGTAVLTGALLVGDSLRGSLREQALNRLGPVDHALVSDQFFEAALAERVAANQDIAEQVVPAMILRGTVLRRDAEGNLVHRAGRVQIIGVDPSFWSLFHDQPRQLARDEAILNTALARELGLQPQNTEAQVEIRLEKPQAIPADSLLGRSSTSGAVVIKNRRVADVLPPDAPAGRFSLNPQQSQPLTIFVSRDLLQITLERAEEHIELPKNAANVLLVAAIPQGRDLAAAQQLQSVLAKTYSLEDAGLSLRQGPEPVAGSGRYLSLESRRLLLEPSVAKTVLEPALKEHWRAVPTLTYLANLITYDQQDRIGKPFSKPPERYAPYSAVTGLDPKQTGESFQLVGGGTFDRSLARDEILVNDWLAQDLWPKGNWQEDVGNRVVKLQYFVEGKGWLLDEKAHTFRLAGVVKMEGPGPATDQTLTPDFAGLRETSVRNWKPPFPREQWHPEWVRDRDERYWQDYRATPKAFVSPETAQELWKSDHGQWTSIRIFPPAGTNLDEFKKRVDERLRQTLSPEKLGLRFQPVKEQGLQAAGSRTSESFGWLFLGFSSFLIASAAMLVGLLFRLGIERRAKEIGLLYAAGFRRGVVLRLLLLEGAIQAGAGAVFGLMLAVGYAWLLIAGLRNWWSSTLQTGFLRLHISASEDFLGPLPYPSLVLGFLFGSGIALLAIFWAVRGLARVSPRGLLAGQTLTDEPQGTVQPRRWLQWASALALAAACGLALASFFLPPSSAPPLFFASGALLLIGGLALLALWMRSSHTPSVQGHGAGALARLGAGNVVRHRGRSLLTAGLLASATFLIVAVESFRQGGAETSQKTSGTGGFALLAEADVPLNPAPRTAKERQELLRDLETEDPAKAKQLSQQLDQAVIYGLRVRPGDDVSCLNLYQPQQPRLLGVPDDLVERGGFTFGSLLEPSDAEKHNPWLLLKRQFGEQTIPMLADEHTATWILHLTPGDEWTVKDEQGRAFRLRLVGLLKGSIFQSELLVSEENFSRLFPSRGGYGFFLIETAPDQTGGVKQALDQAFGERFGFDVSASADRLAAFQAVENTYLSTFQVLGGLGLLLGTLGLAVVLLRNVWERQGELALLRALGYSRAALGWLVLAENGFLVLLGLAVGVLSALLAVAPHLFEQNAQTPWLGILGLVVLELIFGLFAGALAVFSTLRTPLLPALRRE